MERPCYGSLSFQRQRKAHIFSLAVINESFVCTAESFLETRIRWGTTVNQRCLLAQGSILVEEAEEKSAPRGRRNSTVFYCYCQREHLVCERRILERCRNVLLRIIFFQTRNNSQTYRHRPTDRGFSIKKLKPRNSWTVAFDIIRSVNWIQKWTRDIPI